MPEPVVALESTSSTPAVVPSSAANSTVVPPSTTDASTTATKSYTYTEDRSNWVTPDKLKANERAWEHDRRRAAKLEADLAEATKRVQALAGVAPADPDADEAQKVLAALYAMAPHLRPDRIAPAHEAAERLQQAEKERWDDHRDAIFDDLKGRVAKALGKDKLGESAARKVVAAFKAYVPDQEADPDAYAVWARRYQRNDPTLLDEFVEEFTSDFLTPAMRAGLVRPKVAVPSGGFSRPVVKTEEKPKPGNLDAAMDRYVSVLRERQAG